MTRRATYESLWQRLLVAMKDNRWYLAAQLFSELPRQHHDWKVPINRERDVISGTIENCR